MKIKNTVSDEDLDFLYDLLIFFDFAALALIVLAEVIL